MRSKIRPFLFVLVVVRQLKIPLQSVAVDDVG